jgi:hypothetical protein
VDRFALQAILSHEFKVGHFTSGQPPSLSGRKA